MPSYAFQDPYTGHTYELILGSCTFSQAIAGASAMSIQGESGYLATLSSTAEQVLLQKYLTANSLFAPGLLTSGSDHASAAAAYLVDYSSMLDTPRQTLPCSGLKLWQFA